MHQVINHKINELRILATYKKLDMLGVCETWLDERVDDNEISI